MKNIIVRLRDVEGEAFPTADVAARYTRTVILTDGTVIPTAIKPKDTTVYESGSAVSFDVYASDDPDVTPETHGFSITFTATTNGRHMWAATVTPLNTHETPTTIGELIP